MAFKRANKRQARLRMAITGPTGAGKTYTALEVGKHLGTKIALIDTERGSASKYAGDVADFDVDELAQFSIPHYLEAILNAEREGYDVLIIDSLTHAWSGKGGLLEEVDKRGGKFDAWRWATPVQQRLVDTILSYPGHVIATIRSKMSYEVETTEKANGRRETTVKKLGMAPQQRDDLPYEFDVILDMDQDNNAKVSKTRCAAIRGDVITMPGKDLADKLKAWLSDGAPRSEEDRPLNTVAKTALEIVVEAFERARTHEAVEAARDLANLHRPALTRQNKEDVVEAMKAAIARVEDILANGDPEPDDEEWLKRPGAPEASSSEEEPDVEKAFQAEAAARAAEAAAAAAAAATTTKSEQGGT